ncbi:hypothetical protein MYAM1_003875 [Malassezia yamatoensis]|uniref:Pre-mRNA-splicing factor SPF27 n=1 Tax=Malassezia yamatoensis TaxID=253288 RepID=A0AAJ6CJS8_9BASI|nr:hypothetical protein MYAM1_003875 [Malassezia yamatoensis]
MSIEHLLPYTDALPYYDQEIDKLEGMRDLVDAEIEKEKTHLSYDPMTLLPQAYAVPSFLSEEMQRADRGERYNAIDTKRYQAQPPEAGHKAAEQEWEQSIQCAETQLGHMEVRAKNIELLRRYGANVWRLHNYNQEGMLQLQTRAEQQAEEACTEVNRSRKQAQLAVGEKLAKLQSRWAALVSKNLSIRAANLTAEVETAEYRKRARVLEQKLREMDANLA